MPAGWRGTGCSRNSSTAAPALATSCSSFRVSNATERARHMITRGELGAVILAGGRGQRMGGAEDKAWVTLQGRPLITHVIERIQPQVGQHFVSANRNLERYSALGVTTVVDRWPDQRGPLAGIDSALAVNTSPYLLLDPCDTPILPADHAARLATALIANAADAAVAHSAGRAQPLCALARRTLAP